MSWKKLQIETPYGKQEAVAPEIISASRSTDIPAFYADWFMNRLRDGYAIWVNPFNQKKQYVSFDRTRAVVFWSKNPKPLLKHLKTLDNYGFSYYFQFTVNDYEQEGLEPNVPPLEDRTKTFIELSKKIGKERVIWRFDPLILTNQLSEETLLAKIEKVGQELHPYTEKLVFSFADISLYAKVQRNLKESGIKYCEFTKDAMHTMAAKISSMAKGWGLKVASCGEKIDLDKYGIEHNKCIDDDLLARIAPDDRILLSFLGRTCHNNLFDFDHSEKVVLKDKGQRMECGCIVSKDIGMYNTCGHLCMYCYANTSPRVVRKNTEKIDVKSPSIVPF